MDFMLLPKIIEHVLVTWRKQESVQLQCKTSSTPNLAIEAIKYSSMWAVTSLLISFNTSGFNRSSLPIDPVKKALEHMKNTFFDVLEKSGVYNWTRCTMPVIPLRVPDDQNSLCHSVSIHVFGIPDNSLFIRQRLAAICQQHIQQGSPLYKRWILHNRQSENSSKRYNAQNLKQEWADLCNAPLSDCRNHENSLKNSELTNLFYVFVLSQLTRRTIVLVGNNNNDFESSVFFPVMVPEEECLKCPIYIAYHQNAFSPLVFVNNPSTDEEVRDSCIPLTDRNFKLFKFFFLDHDEDPSVLISKYTRNTKIGYTTETDFVEVPAVRLPIKKCEDNNKSGVNSVLSLCVDAFESSGNPQDLSDMWQYVSNLKPSNFPINEQRSHNLCQPENDDDIERDDYVSEASHVMQLDCIAPSCNFSNNIFHDSSNGLTIGYPEQSRKNPMTVEPDLTSFPLDSTQVSSEEQMQWLHESAVNVKEPQFRPVSSSLRNSFEETMLCGVQDINLYENQPQQSSSSRNFDNHERIDSTQQQGALIKYSSPSHVVINNPGKISYANFLLEVKDEIKVKVKLINEERNGATNNPTRLFIEKLTNLHTNFKHVGFDKDLEMVLVEIEDHFILNVKLPGSVVVEDQTAAMKCVGSLWSDDSDCGSPFIEMENHDKKCRTGGCIGLGLRQYRGLCESCYRSWNQELDRLGESPIDFDTSSCDESDDGSHKRKCARKSCKNTGEKQFYGFCSTCFHTSNS